MSNIMLDRLPDNFEGYIIRTDFRVGVQITLCSCDPELENPEKIGTMLHLLYGRGAPPDLDTAMRGLNWFLMCGKNRKKDDAETDKPVMSFDYDDTVIYSAFHRVYGIDLTERKMHWFKFLPLLRDIEGTALSNIIDIRTRDTSGMKGKELIQFQRAQKRFELPTIHTPEEEAKINDIMERIKNPQPINQ